MLYPSLLLGNKSFSDRFCSKMPSVFISAVFVRVTIDYCSNTKHNIWTMDKHRSDRYTPSTPIIFLHLILSIALNHISPHYMTWLTHRLLSSAPPECPHRTENWLFSCTTISQSRAAPDSEEPTHSLHALLRYTLLPIATDWMTLWHQAFVWYKLGFFIFPVGPQRDRSSRETSSSLGNSEASSPPVPGVGYSLAS